MPLLATAYVLDAPGAPLVRRPLSIPEPAPGEAIVEVMACGLCHTDLSYASGAVPTKMPPPLVLGHEVVGRIAAAGEGVGLRAGDAVLVPAVLPCGECELCRRGRGNACAAQKMPGNDLHGGFATHLRVPARPLVSLSDFADVDLPMLSVVADAVSTAYQAVRRSALEPGDFAVVVGAGGVGGFVVQVASALGARVLALDVRAERLDLVGAHGAHETMDLRTLEAAAARKRVRERARSARVPSHRLRIFECSGTRAGQALAFQLLDRAATLVQVGYAPEAVEVRLSNLMAYDATVHGTWGCPPEAYPDVLALVREGRVRIAPFVSGAPMSTLNDLLGAMAEHRLERRMILDPRA
jgi:6-hydroxycyclohex-1-ene-1-carbonyl-CoA dehydrogenase